jgi:mannitol/fructose-specific phosphotransferase system IIA component
VHWLRFKLNKDQITRFLRDRVVIGIAHKNYGHMAVLSDETRAALAKDFS